MERAYVLTDMVQITLLRFDGNSCGAPVEHGKARLPTLDEAQRKIIIQASAKQAVETRRGKNLGLEDANSTACSKDITSHSRRVNNRQFFHFIMYFSRRCFLLICFYYRRRLVLPQRYQSFQ